MYSKDGGTLYISSNASEPSALSEAGWPEVTAGSRLGVVTACVGADAVAGTVMNSAVLVTNVVTNSFNYTLVSPNSKSKYGSFGQAGKVEPN